MSEQPQVGVIDEARGLSVDSLDPEIEIVRFRSFPYLWVLRDLFAHAPRVHTVLVPRTLRGQVENSTGHREILKQHTVKLASSMLTGKKRIDFKMRSYKERQSFMRALDPERQALFDELLSFGIVEAEITHRYYCLGGEAYLSPHEVAKMFGCSKGGLQIWVGMVLYYLDSPLKVPKQSIDYVPMMQKQVVRERERLHNIDVQKDELAQHGLERVPAGMPLRFLEQYALIYRAWQIDELSELTVNKSERSVLVGRYGLEDGIFRSLEEVGTARNVTRERIRQIEMVALRKLRKLERR